MKSSRSEAYRNPLPSLLLCVAVGLCSPALDGQDAGPVRLSLADLSADL